jgi:AcrR family transcriptional regulator
MAETKMKSAPGARERLSREDWLEQALEVLSREGEGRIRVDSICRALGVTKGSFYWHFKSRSDFMQSLLEYWNARYTNSVRERAEAMGGPAEERLRFLFGMVLKGRLARYDSAFDAWAAHEPHVASVVREVYQIRYEYVESLLREMGFRGVGLETRTVALLGFLKFESAAGAALGHKRSGPKDEAQFRFFTRESGM